mgnify:CR=1 FL=1
MEVILTGTGSPLPDANRAGPSTLVKAGDCVHQRPGVRHYLFDYSPDMEYLEIVGPADFKTIDALAPCEVPPVTPWTETPPQSWRDAAL